ncbi:MAG: toxin-antitoxin system HicB family antitoxin [Syntrophobacteraceae bacterium]
MEDDKRKQLQLRLSEETHRKLRLLAADLNVTMNDLIVELVEKEYDNVEIVLPKKRSSSKMDESSDYSMTQSMRLMRTPGKVAADPE